MPIARCRSLHLGTFTPEQASRIHEMSLDILAEVGFRVFDPECLHILREAGAIVDLTHSIARLKPEMVERALLACPKRVTLYGRNGDASVLGEGKIYLGTGTHRLNILDYQADAYRVSTQKDMQELATLADALPEISVVSPMVSANDMAAEIADLVAIKTLMLHTGKHTWNAPLSHPEAQITLDLAEILGDGNFQDRPTVSLFASATSPLTLAGEVGQILLEAVRRGAVLAVGSCAAAGATAPITLAGTVLLQNAETLFLVTLAQIVKPRAPVLYAAGSTIANMQTATFSLGAVEYSLIKDAAMALANRYDLPYYTTCDTNSPRIDVQNGIEKMLGYLFTLASGANYCNNAGSLNDGVTVSREQLVLDDEIIRIAERFFKGIRFDDDTLALDLIKQIGPEGEYLTSDHTLAYCRSGEHYNSSLLNFAAIDAPGMLARAHEQVEEILATHRYETPDDQVKQAEQYVRERTGMR